MANDETVPSGGQPDLPAERVDQRLRPFISVSAALCWIGAISMLLLGNLHLEFDPLAPARLLYYALLLLAGLLTFVPLEIRMGLPYLSVMGIGGTSLLLYTLAFVPAPRGSLLSLPDLPVYVLLISALFWSGAALAMPFVYAISRRIFAQRALALDMRRIRRQSYEIGGFLACLAALGGLRVLTWVSALLVILIFVVTEMLFLSRVDPELTSA
jgi:hypothetical protein